MSKINYSLDFELNDNNFLSNLFGVDDKNIQIINTGTNTSIALRIHKIKKLVIGVMEIFYLPKKIMILIEILKYFQHVYYYF